MRAIEALEIDSQAQAHAAQGASAPATLTSARGSLGEDYGCPAHSEAHPCGACAMDSSRHDTAHDPRPYHQRARLTPFGSEPWDYGTTEAA